MKKLLLALTILFVVAVIVSIFVPANIYTAGIPEEGAKDKDPHFHTGTWTTCMNELTQDCNS